MKNTRCCDFSKLERLYAKRFSLPRIRIFLIIHILYSYHITCIYYFNKIFLRMIFYFHILRVTFSFIKFVEQLRYFFNGFIKKYFNNYNIYINNDTYTNKTK